MHQTGFVTCTRTNHVEGGRGCTNERGVLVLIGAQACEDGRFKWSRLDLQGKSEMATLRIVAEELGSLSEAVERNDAWLEEIHGRLLEQKDERIRGLETKNSDLLDAAARAREERGWRDWQAMRLANEIGALQGQIGEGNGRVCELEVSKAKTRYENYGDALKQEYIRYQRRVELLEGGIPVYTSKIEEQLEHTRTSFKELHRSHNARNRVLLQRLRHAIGQYTDLCEQVEESMKGTTHGFEL